MIIENLFFLIIGGYIYYEFLKEGWIGRLFILSSFLGILRFGLDVSYGNPVNWLRSITLLICAFSLEENTAFLIRKLKKYITAKKEEKTNKMLGERDEEHQ